MNYHRLLFIALSTMMSVTMSTNKDHVESRRFGSDERTTRAYGLTTSPPASSIFAPRRVRHRRSRGKYTMKEEIVRRVEALHPCGLAKTAVKVTFPGMKSEVLVSFLGYKEPNLIHVNRCKGRCGDSRHISCVPVRRKMKKIRMHLRTQVIGSDKKKDKYRELILEEHEECSCTCLTLSPAHCLRPSLFSNETCSCTCDNSQFRRERLDCEAASSNDMLWDTRSCSCQRKADLSRMSSGYPDQSVQTRLQGDATTYNAHDTTSFFHNNEIALDSRCAHCLDCMNKAGILSVYRNQSSPIFESWSLLVICSLLISIFFSTTLYYWKKSRRLLLSMSGKETPQNDQNEQSHSNNFANNNNSINSSFPVSPSLLPDHQIHFDHNGEGNMDSIMNNYAANVSHNGMKIEKSPNLKNGRCKRDGAKTNASHHIATVEEFRGRTSSEPRRKNHNLQPTNG